MVFKNTAHGCSDRYDLQRVAEQIAHHRDAARMPKNAAKRIRLKAPRRFVTIAVYHLFPLHGVILSRFRGLWRRPHATATCHSYRFFGPISRRCLSSSVLWPRRGTSDAGQAVWIPEKFWAWTDCDGRLSYRRPARQRHALLVTTTATSPARLYWESFGKRRTTPVVKVPTGGAGFPKEIISQRSSSRNCLCGMSGRSSGLCD